MTIKNILMAAALLVSPAIFAQQKEIVCGEVGGVEEWRITIDMKKNVADFFDNDNVIVAKFKTMKVLESYPAQYLYIYEGMDGRTPFSIQFNKTKMKASITFHSARPKSYTAQAGCREVVYR